MTSPNDLAIELGVADSAIRRWLRNTYPRPAGRSGSNWSLSEEQVAAARQRFSPGSVAPDRVSAPHLSRSRARGDSDESYVIDLCDEVMCERALRQHTFSWLRGDPSAKGATRPLPVDAFYEQAGLVVEYLERQHDQPVDHFDKPDVLTVSGVHRGEQRRIYDARRKSEIPRQGLRLINVHATELDANATGRLRRSRESDLQVLRRLLQANS